MVPTDHPAVVAFLALVTMWMFMRRGQARDRTSLALAALIYVTAMALTFWRFGPGKKGELILSCFAETIGLLLVVLSRRINKEPKDPPIG
ncbi:MAG: hypothetical protein ACLQU3_29330 [Limisphaerales bacterium]